MSGLDLDAIEARANAATPGPWIGPTYRQVLAGLATSTGGHYVDGPFIRHAREDVPALVAEVRRLRAALAWHTDGPGPEITTVYDRDGDRWERDGNRWRAEGDGEATPWGEVLRQWGPVTADPPEVAR